jgi:Flp pilus assembly pilin Flp
LSWFLTRQVRWRFGATSGQQKLQRSERENKLIEQLKKLHTEESGQDIIEYVLIAVLITVAAMATLPIVGQKVSNYWVNLNNKLT